MNNLGKFVIIISIFLFFFSETRAKEPFSIFSGGQNLNVIFLVDSSGSMFSGGKYLAVKSAIESVLDSSTLNFADFSLLTWGSGTCNWSSSVTCPWNYRWVPLSKQKNRASFFYNKIYIKNAIYDPRILYYGGGTNLNNPINFIFDYLTSNDFKNSNSACTSTILVVLSDGFWTINQNSYNKVKVLNDKRNIKTYAVAFGVNPEDSRYPNFNTLAEYGGTSEGFGGINVDAEVLASKFKEIIQLAIYDSLTTLPPVIIPKSSKNNTNSLKDDILISPEFIYSGNGQWKGFLKADKLNEDGTFGNEIWEFGLNLSKVDPKSRNIWTAAPGFDSPSLEKKFTPNNLTEEVSSEKLVNIFETDGVLSDLTKETDAKNLLKFLRGYDVFDEDKSSETVYRWPLNDIYNSKPLFVGQPDLVIPNHPDFKGGDQYFYNLNPSAYINFIRENKNRIPVIYVGSNGGMLHAINAIDGSELWAFVPPPILNKLKNILTSQANTSQSIYTVDGLISSKDVFVSGKWRTYIAFSFGRGARAYTVLDVTDPLSPIHVVSIENAQEGSKTAKTIKWGSKLSISGQACSNNISESNTVVECINGGNFYVALGFISSELIFSYGTLINQDNYTPVLIIPGGEGDSFRQTGGAVYKANLGNYGSGPGSLLSTNFVYDFNSKYYQYWLRVSETSFGNVIKVDSLRNFLGTIPLGSYIAGGGIRWGTRVKSVINDRTIELSQNLTRNLPVGSYFRIIFGIDSEITSKISVIQSGQILSMNGSFGNKTIVPNNNGTLTSFDESSSVISKIPYNTGGEMLVDNFTTYFNDRNITQPITVLNQTYTTTKDLNILYGTGNIYEPVYAKRIDNIIVSIQDKDSNIFKKTSSNIYKQVQNCFTPDCYASGVSSRNIRNLSQFFDSTLNKDNCPSETQAGWIIYLNRANAIDIVSNEKRSCKDGRLSGQIEISNGIALIPVFIPIDAGNISSISRCGSGNSAILFRDVKCGFETSTASGGIYMRNTIISGIEKFKDKVYISLVRNKKKLKTNDPVTNKMVIKGNKAVINSISSKEFFKNPGIIKSKIRIN
mgnify:FL=1